MKIIADSGSTKTDWRICLNDGSFEQQTTGGLNPNFCSADDFNQSLKEAFSATNHHQVTEVWFYGAGCASEKNVGFVTENLSRYFPAAKIAVATDMLGAARALCGTQPGMAAILGTGMNTCVYNGHEITNNHFSLGYILGDEGSGAFLGKLLITDWLKDKLPAELAANLERRFGYTKTDVIEQVYRKPLPNRFLAQFSKFIYQNLKHEYCVQLVIGAFRSFFREQILTYPNYQQYPLHLTGSVAFYFSNLLTRVAAEEGVVIGKIVEKPIAALALYHTRS